MGSRLVLLPIQKHLSVVQKKKMDRITFNELLEKFKTDKAAKNELCHYCLANIKRRLILRYGYANGTEELKDLSHDILKGILKRKTLNYVYAPFKYINRSTDNHMANCFKNKKIVLPLEKELSYEQRFEEIDKYVLYRALLNYLDERSAKIIYLHYIEEISEKEIAEKSGISYANVRAIASRGIKKLRENFKSVTEFINTFS